MIYAPLKVFISYDPADKIFYDELLKRLLPLQREGTISISSHSTVELGKEWEKETIEQLKQAGLILLLISPDFIASEHCYTVELKQAIERHHAGTARVIPLILRPTEITGTPFQGLQALPRNSQPLSSQKIDEAFYQLMRELRTGIEECQHAPHAIISQSINTLPYERNFLFTGRDDLLERLHRSFQTGTTTTLTQAISGLGGIGKTQTALEYAYRYHQEYEAILWVKADSAETMAADIARIAEALQLPERLEEEQAKIMSDFKRWLREHEHWLLLLDNADGLALIHDLPPLHAKGHTLILQNPPQTAAV